MVKTIFIGTSQFAANVLSKIIKSKYRPLLIITNPDRPAGRGKKIKETPVSFTARDNKIKLLKPEKISDLTNEIKKEYPDLILVCAYGQKIPKEIIKIPRKGCLNLHPSFLPKYRGSSPISQAILNGDEETGVTIMLINEKIDQGPIINQKKHRIKENSTFLELAQELAEKGSELLIKTIPQWIDNKIIAKEQDDSEATYTKIMEKEDGKIDWNKSADEIERQIRALNPRPGTFALYEEKETKELKKVKILSANTQEQTQDGPFGVIGKVYVATNNNLAVQTGKNFLIIKKLQMENKNPVTSEDFINGNINFIGTILK